MGFDQVGSGLNRDPVAIAEVRNQAVGLDGNAVFDTSDAYHLSGVVCRCN